MFPYAVISTDKEIHECTTNAEAKRLASDLTEKFPNKKYYVFKNTLVFFKRGNTTVCS